MNTKHKNTSRGSVIFIVLALLLTVSLIGITVLQLVTNDNRLIRSQTHIDYAEQAARAGIAMMIYQFKRTDIDLLQTLVETPLSSPAIDCNQAKTLCFSGASFNDQLPGFDLPHHAFRIDSFGPFTSTIAGGNSIPGVYADYLVKVHSPMILATQTTPGYSLSLNLCMYQVTITSTGFLINPNTDKTVSSYKFATKKLETQINVTATNPSICP